MVAGAELPGPEAQKRTTSDSGPALNVGATAKRRRMARRNRHPHLSHIAVLRQLVNLLRDHAIHLLGHSLALKP